MNKRVAIYARVSSPLDKDKKSKQDTENQVLQLRGFAARDGPIHKEYIDYVTGKHGDRDQFKQLFEDARQGKFDLVVFWALDRFSREGVLETLQYLQKLTSYKVDWKSYTEQYLDSCGIFKDAVLAILATVAKQERIRLSERTIAGLERVRKNGPAPGKKEIGRPKLVNNRFKMYELAKSGMSIRLIAEHLQVSKSTVERRIKEYERIAGITPIQRA